MERIIANETEKKALFIQGLDKTYRSGVQAVKGVNFIVEEGEVHALLGPNGAGKTTTIKSILGFINYKGDIKANYRIYYLPLDFKLSQGLEYLSAQRDKEKLIILTEDETAIETLRGETDTQEVIPNLEIFCNLFTAIVCPHRSTAHWCKLFLQPVFTFFRLV
ncbi:MAG: ATP-binding cassette domain-containing protein [Thermotogota bacterium]|nr:ATP-binding cassette domain-containing protein [Thermotogota bacterium]